MKNKNVYQVIKSDERFSILAQILESTGIGEAMAQEQKVFTFFAPTDTALSHFPQSAIKLLKSPDGKDLAVAILGRHVVPGTYLYSDDLRKQDRLKPLNGGYVKIKVEKNALKYGRAPVRTPGIAAMNGVVFPVDRILPARTRRIPRA